MGFLSKLLNPKSATRMAFDPAGGTIAAARNGGDASQGLLDPSGLLIKSGANSGAGAPNDPNAAVADPAAGVGYGDPNDPSYGSFTQPFDVTQFYNYADPGYAFQLQQGTQGLQNSAAAQSGALSGAALKDLMSYNQQYAGTAYNDAFNRYQTQQGNIFSRLSDIAHLGQSAAAGVGNQGTTLAGNAGQQAYNAGSAEGAGIVGAGNAAAQGAQNYWLYNNPQLWQQPKVSAGGV